MKQSWTCAGVHYKSARNEKNAISKYPPPAPLRNRGMGKKRRRKLIEADWKSSSSDLSSLSILLISGTVNDYQQMENSQQQ